ncbi:MAG: glycerol-phosphate dehydrogenase, partial [Chloroflexota bacterium]|nr:glycerol-phosphate dehydrogenase [Chloroflexota bacterium]
QYRRKLDAWDAVRPALGELVDAWPRIRAELDGLLGRPRDIATILRAAGAPATFEELDPPATRETATWALYNGHLIRDRFTLADLAWFAGLWTPELARSAIDDAAAIAASVAEPGPEPASATARAVPSAPQATGAS